jgi:hypothetical protein
MNSPDIPAPDHASEELRGVKKQLRECRRKLKESQALNERLLKLIGTDELHGWKPQEQVEREYGWIHAWLFPLYSYLNQKVGQPLTPDIRDRAIDITRAIIAQLVVRGKYGVELPLDPREVDGASFVARQERIFKKEYEPCAICGENRITHESHIIPRSEGGPLHRDNFVTLCPLHHHLFDHDRLSPEEWDKLMGVIEETKMEAAIVYAREVRLQRLRQYWSSVEKSL